MKKTKETTPDLEVQLKQLQQKKLEQCRLEIQKVLQTHKCEIWNAVTIQSDGKIFPQWGIRFKT